MVTLGCKIFLAVRVHLMFAVLVSIVLHFFYEKLRALGEYFLRLYISGKYRFSCFLGFDLNRPSRAPCGAEGEELLTINVLQKWSFLEIRFSALSIDRKFA